jgi:predicted DNA-binding transcriptional regulator AlpA
MGRLFDERQAAQYLGVSRSFLQKARCQKRGPAFFRLGRGNALIRYKSEDLNAWIESNKEGE